MQCLIGGGINGNKKTKKALLKLRELLAGERIREIQSIADEDAKRGHKSEENSFFGYKTHVAMTEERIITGLEVTTGEASDGKQFINLVEKSKKAGIDVQEACGDTAYSTRENLEYAKENNIKLIVKVHPTVTNGQSDRIEGFIFNKDADTMQCPAGNLAARKHIDKSYEEKGKSPRIRYYFDVNKCKGCPLKEGCYKEGAKTKGYSVTIKPETYKEQEKFQETEYFKERMKQRYKIEAKNGELKQAHGLGTAKSMGLRAMRLQSFFAAFAVNVKRIVKLVSEQTKAKPSFFVKFFAFDYIFWMKPVASFAFP